MSLTRLSLMKTTKPKDALTEKSVPFFIEFKLYSRKDVVVILGNKSMLSLSLMMILNFKFLITLWW